MTHPFLGSTSGFTRRQLRNSKYDRLSRDVYVLKDQDQDQDLDRRAWVAAAQLVVPGGIPCLTTAALLQKLPVDDDGVVHLARDPRENRTLREAIEVHRMVVAEDEVLDLDGLQVTNGPRTLADMAALLKLEDLVALGDVVLRRYSSEEVAEALRRAGRRRGVVLLREAVPLLDVGSDSPAETRARLRLHAAGFVALRHKVIVRDSHGGWLGQPDLADEEAKLALQHEGAVHFKKGERQRRKDIDRDEVVRQEDWQVVSSTALDDACPDRLIAKVTAAYRRAAKLWGSHILPPHLR